MCLLLVVYIVYLLFVYKIVILDLLDCCHRLHAGELRRASSTKAREGEERGGGGGREEEGRSGRGKGIIVTFVVREKGLVKSSVGANVGSQSGDMVPRVSPDIYL